MLTLMGNVGRKRWIVLLAATVALIVVAAVTPPAVGIIIALVVAPATIVVAIVAFVRGGIRVVGLSTRGLAALAFGMGLVLFVGAAAAAGSRLDRPSTQQAAASAPATTASQTPAAPTPTPTSLSDEAVEAAGLATAGGASVVVSTASSGSALDVLATLPVQAATSLSGYSRDAFGPAWADVDKNGCDTRNDILARDLTGITRPGSCTVTAGTLTSAYSGAVVTFTRGEKTSPLVQIDHVVSLADAWTTGAQTLTADQRRSLANDPLNLQAVEGTLNEAKSNLDAAGWLPPLAGYRCTFVARQIAVKNAYGLWVTPAEKAAMTSVLASCPAQPTPASSFQAAAVVAQPAPARPAPAPAPAKPAPAQPAPAPAPAKPAPAQPAPAPAQPAPAPAQPDVTYKNCSEVRAAGKAPLYRGQPGYAAKLDRDGDGIACE